MSNNHCDAHPRLVVLFHNDAAHYQSYLQQAGFWVYTVADSASLYQLLDRQVVDIVIIDIEPGSFDYLNLIKHLCGMLDLKVITLSARRDWPHAMLWLEAGADRNLIRPVAAEYLISNLRALLRQLPANTDRKPVSVGVKPVAKPWRLTLSSWILESPAGICLPLNSRELSLLTVLMQAEGKVVTKAQLAAQIYASCYDNPLSRMDMLLSRLRKKARHTFQQALPIKTAYLGGYAFCESCQVI